MSSLRDFQNEIVGSSIRLRLVRSTAEKVVAAATMTRSDLWQCSGSPNQAKRLLRQQIRSVCKENNVGSMMIIIAILGIIINLIWQWWLHRKTEHTVGAAESAWEKWYYEAEEELDG